MIIEESGKYFVVENGQVVAALDELPKEASEEFKVGNRVQHKDKTGSVISLVPNIYGTAVGVKFDDGEINSFEPEHLSKLEDGGPLFSDGVKGLVEEYVHYSKMDDDTLEEIEAKEKLARVLNLRAKAVLTDRKISLHDRIELDRIVNSTAVDTLDFKEAKALLRQADHSEYLDRLPKYELSDSFKSWGSQNVIGEDISWVDQIQPEAGIEYNDLTLVELANDTVNRVSGENLKSSAFMNEVIFIRQLDIPKEHHERFAMHVKNAAEMKLAEPQEKTASVDDDLDSIDERSLFI